MCKFDEECKVYYDRYDKAIETNDKKELDFFSQFCIEKDISKWDGHRRRQMCENARNYQFYLACGLKEIILNDCGWLEWKIPGYEKQEFHPLGCIINRGCCNMKESYALGILQLPNGNWMARCDWYAECLERDYLFIGIHDAQYETKTEAWNMAIKRFVDWWHNHNKDVKKEDEAVVKAKSMLIVGDITPIPKMKGEPIQLSLF